MGRVCWIGLQQNPNKESTQWTWSDGSALDFGFDDEGSPLSGDDSPWQSEQPDLVAEPGSDDTNCVVLSREEEKDGKWGVVSCNELKPTYYALCGMCISTDCAVDCSGDEFAVWPMPEIVKEMEKPSTTQETKSAIDTEELDEDGRSSRSIGGEEEEDLYQDVDQETEETKQLDDLDIPEGSTTAPSAAQIRNSEIDDFENTDDSSNDESGDSEDETEDVYSNESGELYESDINEDSEDESKDDSDDDESAAEDESTDVAPDDESDINEDNISNEHDSDDDKANDSEHDSTEDDADSKDDIITAPTSSPTFEIVECIVDADCDGYRMECNKYAQCAQMTSGSGIYDRAGQAGKGRQEQMNVFRSRVIYVDDIKPMLSNPIWLSGVVLLLIVLVARPMYSCWARSEYKRVATQFDVEHGYQSCV